MATRGRPNDFQPFKELRKAQLGRPIYILFHFIEKLNLAVWWQWCWWHRYVGDFMMVTDFRCWWQNHYVSDFFRYVGDFLNVLNRSPTSWIGHQHLKLVTNAFGHQHRGNLAVGFGIEHPIYTVYKNTGCIFRMLCPFCGNSILEFAIRDYVVYAK